MDSGVPLCAPADALPGYREFSSYLALDQTVPAPAREKAYHAAVERMKTSTRQYAKRQVSWIRNKLLPAAREANALPRADDDSGGDVVATFLLDASGALRAGFDCLYTTDPVVQSSAIVGRPTSSRRQFG